MKTWIRRFLEVAAVVLLLPQVFVFMYYFRCLFIGSNWLGLCKSLSLYGLTVSWVSAPFLVVLTFAIRALVGAEVRWWVTFAVSVGTGYLWIVGWNVLVVHSFGCLAAAVPILLCGLVTTGCAQARALYLESLRPWTPVRTRLVPVGGATAPDDAGTVDSASAPGSPDIGGAQLDAQREVEETN